MNKDLLSKVIIFATGAAIGSAVTYILTRRKYEQVEWEYEEESVEENLESVEQDDDKSEEDLNKEDMVRYNNYVKKYAGNHIVDEMVNNVKGSEDDVDRPYLITVDEYAELDDYEVNSLYYYEDNVLTDELGNVIDDVDDTVGADNLKKFDDMSVDSIYIRNDARMSDYEILRDMGRYYD